MEHPSKTETNAMTKPAGTENFATSTGRSWAQWLAFLDEQGAEGLSHADIAKLIDATGDASGWWAQSITVAYEQHIGRRAPGQRSDGTFEVSVSRTLQGSMDAVMARWDGHVSDTRSHDGVEVEGEPERTETPKWRYWRCVLADGSKVSATASARSETTAGLAVTHGKLADTDDKERWRKYWKGVLASL